VQESEVIHPLFWRTFKKVLFILNQVFLGYLLNFTRDKAIEEEAGHSGAQL
jgi:hypothetical protein